MESMLHKLLKKEVIKTLSADNKYGMYAPDKNVYLLMQEVPFGKGIVDVWGTHITETSEKEVLIEVKTILNELKGTKGLNFDKNCENILVIPTNLNTLTGQHHIENNKQIPYGTRIMVFDENLNHSTWRKLKNG